MPELLRTLAACWFVLALISIAFVRRKRAMVEAEQEFEFEKLLNVREGIRHKSFWLLLFMDVCSMFTFLYVSSVFKTMAI